MKIKLREIFPRLKHMIKKKIYINQEKNLLLNNKKN